MIIISINKRRCTYYRDRYGDSRNPNVINPNRLIHKQIGFKEKGGSY
jgi:hypothetical protein